jgi:hypothetical protein
VYLDGWFDHLALTPQLQFNADQLDHVPHDCDVIGITFYSTNWKDCKNTIDQLLPRTRKLLANFSEPTTCFGENWEYVPIWHGTPNWENIPNRDISTSFCDFLMTLPPDPRLHVFADVKFNPGFGHPGFENIVSWFVYPDNIYVSQPWGAELIKKINKNFDKPKRFDCLLGGKRGHRDIIQSHYIKSHCRDHIVFTYYDRDTRLGIWDLEQYHVYLGRESQRPPNSQLHTAQPHAILPVGIYNQTYYSIVAETTCYNEYSQYTEKVAKPMLAGRPFVAFCGQHYLANLRDLGFQTFGDVIDESYDSVENLDQRMAAAWQQVEWLCAQDPQEVYRALDSVLTHNREHFLETDWHAAIRRHLQF